MILRLSEDEVKEAVIAWIAAKTPYLVEKEQVKLEITAGGSLGTPRFNYAEIDLSKKTPPDSHGYILTGQIRSGCSSAPPKDGTRTEIEFGFIDPTKKPEPPPKPEPPKPEKYTKGD